jgi:hypothetical protein
MTYHLSKSQLTEKYCEDWFFFQDNLSISLSLIPWLKLFIQLIIAISFEADFLIDFRWHNTIGFDSKNTATEKLFWGGGGGVTGNVLTLS